MEAMVANLSFLKKYYKNRRVLVTGHTGFKGSWMVALLASYGAEVAGYSLRPQGDHSLFELAGIGDIGRSTIGDVRDYPSLLKLFKKFQPEVVFHLAAQPIVSVGYKEPRGTYETNVMGTVNLFECCRQTSSVHSVVCITTDKVYENKEWAWGYREIDSLDGYDPYANSKSCSELVAACYNRSFFSDRSIAISTTRAGNVIGGGDFALNRIVPDCIRAARNQADIIVRNPYSIRPYQHVLEPTFAYLVIAAAQAADKSYADCYNIGPENKDCVRTGLLADIFCEIWGNGIRWINKPDTTIPHEANFLKLDCSKFKHRFNWSPVWGVRDAMQKTVDWSKGWIAGEEALDWMMKQIEEYGEKLVVSLPS